MRRMHLQPADPKGRKAVDFVAGALHIARMDRAKRKQPIRSCIAILSDPIIHFRRESYHFRADVIDQPRALDSHLVEECQEFRRIARVLRDTIVVPAATLD